jgi:hypothetical protein
MGGINKAKANNVINSYNDWVKTIETYLESVPGEARSLVEDSVGYSTELNGFIESTRTTVSTELTAKIKKTVDALQESISDISSTHETQASETSAKKINFEVE